MSRVRVVALAVAIGGVAMASSDAFAALSDVRLGNFYYEDASVGDGKIEINQGDQIRFIAEDNGPGTPHTVEIDELGIHSGGLSTGETYTTPVINQAGTFDLYCKFHENRGHLTTLVVRARSTATSTTKAPAPTSTAPAPTSAAPKPTSSPSPSLPATSPEQPSSPPPDRDDPLVGAAPEATGEPLDDDAVVVPADQVAGDRAGPGEADDVSATTARAGVGRVTEDELATLPTTPGPLDSILGRPAAAAGPWTRSLRLAAIAAFPLTALAAVAVRRHKRLHAVGDQ